MKGDESQQTKQTNPSLLQISERRITLQDEGNGLALPAPPLLRPRETQAVQAVSLRRSAHAVNNSNTAICTTRAAQQIHTLSS